MNLERDFAKLGDQLDQHKPVQIQLNHVDSLEGTVANGLVGRGLARINQMALTSSLQLVLHELLMNARDAWIRSQLGANGAATPAAIDAQFSARRQELRSEWESHAESDCTILIDLHLQADQFQIQVSQRQGVSDLDREQIRLALNLGWQAERLSDITSQARHYGLAFSALCLKQALFMPDVFSYDLAADQTVFRLQIPANHACPQKLARVDQSLVQEIKSLPGFPDQIKVIQDLCESEKSDLRQVALAIQKDTTVASQIIKLANSGGYGGGGIIELFDAVKVVGLKNISDLLLQIGALKAISDRYALTDDFMQHPVRVGFYARSLARLQGRAALTDKAYVAGLLHDIGKIVLMAGMPDKHSFERAVEHKDTRTVIQIEEISLGVNHAVVGALLAKKWQFPEVLQQCIEYHHDPLKSRVAAKELKELVYIVYMANAMANTIESEYSYYALEPEVLAWFNMTTLESFELCAGNFETEYRQLA
ncbi:MAG: HDOD domain-containing protein [Leptospiraceae bacterium]|nr:HDOD domain-containing protein [Leptospiraceae bacterium]